ncbi:MAG: AAA family ATPase [Candidatus Solibacter sp.]
MTKGNDGAIGFKCQHNGCADKHWSDVREKFDGPRVKAKPADRPAAVLPQLVSASALYDGDVVRLRPLLEGLIWDGLSMVVAKPKTGKSWLMLQCAICVAGGPGIEGVTAFDHGPVLYGAFEEPAARTMARLRQLAPAGDWANNLHFVYDLLPLMGGGAEQLEALIEQLRPRMVVLDTLTAVIKGGGKRESDVFRSQYAEVSRVRKIAERFGIAVVLIHHARKGTGDGAVESVAGTGGVAAAVDTLWCLKRKPEGEATLEVIGREAEEKTFALKFDQNPFGWRVLGDDAAQLLNAERRQVLDLLREEGALSPAQIALELAKPRPAIRQLLKRMREDGQVRKQGSKYVPSLSMSHSVTERERD